MIMLTFGDGLNDYYANLPANYARGEGAVAQQGGNISSAPDSSDPYGENQQDNYQRGDAETFSSVENSRRRPEDVTIDEQNKNKVSGIFDDHKAKIPEDNMNYGGGSGGSGGNPNANKKGKYSNKQKLLFGGLLFSLFVVGTFVMTRKKHNK